MLVMMTESTKEGRALADDMGLQNAVLAEAEHIMRGVTISPGATSAKTMYQALGVKARSPSYTLEQFETFLDAMVKRGLLKSEKYYQTTKTLYV
jgi:hypothetical protein